MNSASKLQISYDGLKDECAIIQKFNKLSDKDELLIKIRLRHMRAFMARDKVRRHALAFAKSSIRNFKLDTKSIMTLESAIEFDLITIQKALRQGDKVDLDYFVSVAPKSPLKFFSNLADRKEVEKYIKDLTAQEEQGVGKERQKSYTAKPEVKERPAFEQAPIAEEGEVFRCEKSLKSQESDIINFSFDQKLK